MNNIIRDAYNWNSKFRDNDCHEMHQKSYNLFDRRYIFMKVPGAGGMMLGVIKCTLKPIFLQI